ncbi:RDD family protein [Nocardia sp. NPDC051832]|uniref:RDD family protein n=1 Tax=Nocardia sp. NPDC051832 TaxID=3155673 RepID=UPI00343813C4
MLTGLVLLPLFVVLLNLADRQPPGSSAERLLDTGGVLAGASGVLLTTFSLAWVWINRRRRKALRRHPWQVWHIRYLRTGRYEWVTLLDGNGREVSSLLLSTWAHQLGQLVDHQTPTIWFAGDPHKYGIISAPGGADLRYAYVSRSHPAPRFTFAEHAAQDDLAGRNPQLQLTRNSHGQVSMQRPAESGADEVKTPRPYGLRRACAFAIDWCLHLACGIGIGAVASPGFSPDALGRKDWAHLGVNPFLVVACWLLASAIHRVAIQALVHTTLGKALFGLRVTLPDFSGSPSFGRLLRVWTVDLYLIFALPLDFFSGGGMPGPDKLDDYFLPARRWAETAARP